jgi:hypothetical protein
VRVHVQARAYTLPYRQAAPLAQQLCQCQLPLRRRRAVSCKPKVRCAPALSALIALSAEYVTALRGLGFDRNLDASTRTSASSISDDALPVGFYGTHANVSAEKLTSTLPKPTPLNVRMAAPAGLQGMGILEGAAQCCAVVTVLPVERRFPAGGVDSIAFTCDPAMSEKCPAGGVLDWSCSAQCGEGKACDISLGRMGLNGTLPAAVGDLRCAGRITSL